MTISISLNRILVCILVSALAALGWWIVTDSLHWPAWAAMWVFGFILLVLSIAITERVVT